MHRPGLLLLASLLLVPLAAAEGEPVTVACDAEPGTFDPQVCPDVHATSQTVDVPEAGLTVVVAADAHCVPECEPRAFDAGAGVNATSSRGNVVPTVGASASAERRLAPLFTNRDCASADAAVAWGPFWQSLGGRRCVLEPANLPA